MMTTIKLRKEHYDKTTKLEQILDFWDCPICMMFVENVLECSKCTARACPTCLADFSKKEYEKNPALKAQGIYKCS